MILVAGGQLDFNIGRLLARMLERRISFIQLLVGPQLVPSITLDLARDELRLDGRLIRPTACFMRHDVFLQMSGKTSFAQAAALNWYGAIKGWELAHDDVRGFNKASSGAESTKLCNLYIARSVGFAIPETLVTNEFDRAATAMQGALIQKPVAGGEYTSRLGDLRKELSGRDAVARYPRFVQRKLLRPEMRIYRVGDDMISFHLASRDLDYRERNRVKLTVVKAPRGIESKLRALTDRLGLDFAAADFMRNGQGRYCFLEVNTQPMFAAFDKVANGRLCDAIIHHLSRPPATAKRR